MRYKIPFFPFSSPSVDFGSLLKEGFFILFTSDDRNLGKINFFPISNNFLLWVEILIFSWVNVLLFLSLLGHYVEMILKNYKILKSNFYKYFILTFINIEIQNSWKKVKFNI